MRSRIPTTRVSLTTWAHCVCAGASEVESRTTMLHAQGSSALINPGFASSSPPAPRGLQALRGALWTCPEFSRDGIGGFGDATWYHPCLRQGTFGCEVMPRPHRDALVRAKLVPGPRGGESWPVTPPGSFALSRRWGAYALISVCVDAVGRHV